MLFQVKYSKVLCAAKRMHELLLDPGNEGVPLTASGILGEHSRRSSTLISSLSITSRGSSDPSRIHRPRNSVMLGCRRPAMS